MIATQKDEYATLEKMCIIYGKEIEEIRIKRSG